MKHDDFFLDVAHRIGRRIVAQALWDGDVCTWQVMRPDKAHPELQRALPERARGGFYQGTAGIAVFLGELYRVTGEAGVGRAADGALRHALAEAAQLPPSRCGFHNSRVGIAYAAARIAACLNQPDYLERAEEILRPLRGHEQRDRGLDVIGGAAGAIPVLLQLAEVLDPALPLELAVGLGNHLLRVAHREPGGWSWDTMSPAAVRHGLGLAHGAAGIGHALLELYHATGSNHYLYAAEQAFLYERQFFVKEKVNWPDFRYHELGQYYYAGRLDELREVVTDGLFPAYELHFMRAWCHGAPGIGLTRLRAYELLGEAVYKAEAEAAVQATLQSLDLQGWNYSLCHGYGGNCDTLLDAADILKIPGLRARAEACGRQGWEAFEKIGRPWMCGTVGGAADPSLMLGEAGIGYFYLRLYSSETPSILLLRTAEGIGRGVVAWCSHQTLQKGYVDTYFGRTLQVFRILCPARTPIIMDRAFLPPQHESDVSAAYEALCEASEAPGESLRSLLEDAFRPERIRYEMALALTDFSEETLAELVRSPVDDVAWTDVVMELAPHTRVVRSRWDWDAWIELEEQDRPSRPEQKPVFWLLYRAGNKIHERPLSLFAALVLQHLEASASLEQVVLAVAAALEDGDEADRRQLRAMVVEQLKNAYRMGLLRCWAERLVEMPASP